jgi:hypothetical protein
MYTFEQLLQSIDNLNETLLNSYLNTTLNINEIDNISAEIERSNNNNTSLLTHILLGIIGVLICIIGIFGNTISIIVLSKQTMNKLSTYAYLIALSVCDAVGLLFTIIVLLQYSLPPGSIMPECIVHIYPIIVVYVQPIVSASQTLSVWITLALTIDRYLYVCKPYLGSKLCTRRRSCYVICILYILSIIYSIPQFFERKYVIVNVSSKNFLFSSLTEFGSSPTYFRIYHLYIYAIFICLIPFGTIAILNSFLIHNIMKSNKRHRDLHINILKNHSVSCALVETTCPPIVKQAKSMFLNEKQQQGVPLTTGNCQQETIDYVIVSKNVVDVRRKVSGEIKYNDKTYRNDVTVLLIGLVIVFMICQLPSTLLRLITYKRAIMFDPVYVILIDICNFLIVLNSTLNCLLYIMLGKKFRKEFLRTICPNCYLKKTSTQMYLRRLSYFRNHTILNNNNLINHDK